MLQLCFGDEIQGELGGSGGGWWHSLRLGNPNLAIGFGS